MSSAKDFLVPLHLGNFVIDFLNCHLHLVYSTKPNSQVYNRSQFLWLGSIKPQAYSNGELQLLCATQS